MNVGAVGAVGSGVGPVYAALSPFLNGVIRTSDAAAAAQLQATAAAKSAAATAAAIQARSVATAAITAAPPFANPAITAIGERIALGQSLSPPSAVTPNALLGAPAAATAAVTDPFGAIDTDTVTVVNPNTVAPPPVSPTDSVLHGDSGLLIQSYGAVALAASPLAVAALYGLPPKPAIPAVAPVTAAARLARIGAS
jgi:hypothetical protein